MEKITFAQMGLAVAIFIMAIHPTLALVSFFRTQKRVVSMETEYATREALEQVRSDVEIVDGKVETLKAEIIRNGETRKAAIESKVEAARCEARDSADELRKDIGAVQSDLSELKGETKMITQSLARLEMRSYPDGARRIGT